MSLPSALAPSRARTGVGALDSRASRSRRRALASRSRAAATPASSDVAFERAATRRDVLRDAFIASVVVTAAAAMDVGVVRAAKAEDAPADAPAAPATTTKARVTLITGANSGVGYTAAKQLAAQGRTVVLACRTAEKGKRAVDEIKAELGAGADVRALDVGLELGDLRSVREYALEFLSHGFALDALVLNAGIMAAPLERTVQGHELHFGINHLGHFLLADALTPALRESRGRVVSVSSLLCMIGDLALDFDDLDWNARKYDPWYAYGASKAQNVLFADEFARREGANGIVSNSLHPGIVTTNLVRYSVPDMVQSNRDLARERESLAGQLAAKAGIRNPDEGCKTTVWLAAADEAARVNGKFFVDPGLEYPGATREQLVAAGDWFLVSGTEFLAPQLNYPAALFTWRDEANAAKLWATSQEMVRKFTV